MPILIETERLKIRPLKQDDFNEACKMLQDEKVMYAYEGAFSKQEEQDWMNKQFRRYQEDGFGLWAVIEKKSNEIIGQCGITYQMINNKRVPEIGYLFRKEYWHRGYATEAASACREYAFHDLGFPQVYSIIRDTNLASQQVALRIGMHQTGSFIKHYRGIDMLHYIYCISLSTVQ